MNYLKLITPLNIGEERDKFFADQTYAPQFIYAWENSHFTVEAELQELLDALKTQDAQAITTAGEAYFDVRIKDDDIAFANKIIQQAPPKQQTDANECAKLAEAKFEDYGIPYRVEVVDRHGFQARPDHRQQVLSLSKYLRTDYYSAESIVTHELVHIIRAVNGTANNIKPQLRYLGTDEGLASYIQDNRLQGVSGSLFQHSIEYLASIIARDHGFNEVYTFMTQHGCTPETAWMRSIRQKYGLKDTAKPGSVMKAAMQYSHERELITYSDDQLEHLFVGKIRLDQVGEYSAYKGAVSKDVIRDLLKSS